MENNEYVGFDSLEEAELYEDVCIGHLFHKSNKPDYDYVIKKDECIKIIKSYKLEYIFNRVKNLSHFDRLKEIYRIYDQIFDWFETVDDSLEMNVQYLPFLIDWNNERNEDEKGSIQISIILLELLNYYQTEETRYYTLCKIIDEIQCLIDLKIFALSEEEQQDFATFTAKLEEEKGRKRRREDEEDFS